MAASILCLAFKAGTTSRLTKENHYENVQTLLPCIRPPSASIIWPRFLPALKLDADNGFPPYNIERLGENSYRISMAVAGFGDSDLSLEVKEGTLTVRGEKKGEDKVRQYIHQGIAARNFERRFRLAEYVEVSGATLEHGLLHIDLKRELPEAMKPRTIQIPRASPPAPA